MDLFLTINYWNSDCCDFLIIQGAATSGKAPAVAVGLTEAGNCWTVQHLDGLYMKGWGHCRRQFLLLSMNKFAWIKPTELLILSFLLFACLTYLWLWDQHLCGVNWTSDAKHCDWTHNLWTELLSWADMNLCEQKGAHKWHQTLCSCNWVGLVWAEKSSPKHGWATDTICII